MNKNVLIVKLSPINGLNSSMFRALALVKGLVEMDYNVDFVTIRESATTVMNNIDKYEFLNKVNIIYANANSVYDNLVKDSGTKKKRTINLIRSIYHKLYPYDYTMKIAKKITKKNIPKMEYEYAISVSNPKSSHQVIKKIEKDGVMIRNWIQYWGDPMAMDITNKSIYPLFVYKHWEKKLFSKCNSIVYTSPFTTEEQKKLYPSFSKYMKYVPTAYLEEKYFYNDNTTFTIGYYGAYVSTVRNILPFYRAAAEMEDCKFLIIGNSDLSLEEKENIEILPRGDISKYEEITDLYICILNSSGAQIPGKVYHYAATNKPILVILDGENRKEMRTLFEGFGRYYVCDNEKQDIYKSIEMIKKENNKYEPFREFSALETTRKILNLAN